LIRIKRKNLHTDAAIEKLVMLVRPPFPGPAQLLVFRRQELRRDATGSPGRRREADVTGAGAAAPDIEMLALGKQFDEFVRQYHQVLERDRPRIERELQLLEAQDRSEKLDKEFGPQIRPDALDILDMMDAPMHRIMALPATNPAALAAKARVARFSCEHFWDEPEEDLDWEELMTRKLIDAVLDFCSPRTTEPANRQRLRPDAKSKACRS
jgi:hypothetical protein